MLTVDVALFWRRKGWLQLLLIQRQREPFAGKWALPGGFVGIDEGLEEAALRELEEETGMRGVDIVQFRTFGRPDRDPRGRVISVAFLAFLPGGGVKVAAGDDAAAVAWFPIQSLPELAFDHNEIISCALRRLREILKHFPEQILLLPAEYAHEEIDHLFEFIDEKQRD